MSPSRIARLSLAFAALVVTVLWLVLYIINNMGVEKALLFTLVSAVIWLALDVISGLALSDTEASSQTNQPLPKIKPADFPPTT